MVWDSSGQLLHASSLWFGEEAATNNAAEVNTLVALMGWLVRSRGSWQEGVVVVRGDSKLVIDFCNKSARPGEQHLYLAMHTVRELASQLGARVVYRHKPREENTWADWLGRLAALSRSSCDWTT